LPDGARGFMLGVYGVRLEVSGGEGSRQGFRTCGVGCRVFDSWFRASRVERVLDSWFRKTSRVEGV